MISGQRAGPNPPTSILMSDMLTLCNILICSTLTGDSSLVLHEANRTKIETVDVSLLPKVLDQCTGKRRNIRLSSAVWHFDKQFFCSRRNFKLKHKFNIFLHLIVSTQQTQFVYENWNQFDTSPMWSCCQQNPLTMVFKRQRFSFFRRPGSALLHFYIYRGELPGSAPLVFFAFVDLGNTHLWNWCCHSSHPDTSGIWFFLGTWFNENHTGSLLAEKDNYIIGSCRIRIWSWAKRLVLCALQGFHSAGHKRVCSWPRHGVWIMWTIWQLQNPASHKLLAILHLQNKNKSWKFLKFQLPILLFHINWIQQVEQRR